MRKLVQLVLAASLCGCVAAQPRSDSGDQPVSPIPVSLALEEIITAGVRQHLKDPLSARFGTMLAGERTLNGRQEIVVCGTVADKGSSDGSGGDQSFIAKIYPDAGNSFDLVGMGNGSPPAVQNSCRMAGLSMAGPNNGL